MEDSLRVTDAALKVDLPAGPCWRRYSHDGYGEHPDGAPYDGWGVGRAWPLLAGERGHYELAAGRDPGPFIKAMEGFARNGLLPEQLWDAPDIPRWKRFFGQPTGSAAPLVWAHAEYLKLLASARDGEVFDRVPIVADRYRSGASRRDLEVWQANRKAGRVAPGSTLRVLASAGFRLRWADDGGRGVEADAASSGLPKLHYLDIPVEESRRSLVRFVFIEGGGDLRGKELTVNV